MSTEPKYRENREWQKIMMLKEKLPAINDAEGQVVPPSLPRVTDAHVHIFPDGIFRAVWKWFDTYGYPIRYRMRSAELIDFLLSRGIWHIVALQYAHKPGIAEELNQYMADLCTQYPGKVSGMATVFPGEKGSRYILGQAFASGLKGVKLHCHVQCFDMNSNEMDEIYDLCASEKKPLIMHAGREPNSPVYSCDPYALCSADKLEKVLRDFPELKICVPHLGADEYLPYKNLTEKYDNLWLDTAMVLTDYFPGNRPVPPNEMRTERILYGSDFPNIPFAWDRELRALEKLDLPENDLKRILGKNAGEFFSIP
ncbi:MAG: amidohydrolase family protein [Desulfobacterales bacterium]